MKTQTSIPKIFIHAITAVIATAAASPLQAADPLALSRDVNTDGLVDMVVVTSPTTITVSLANWFGGYTVSDILSVPKNQQITFIDLNDRDFDGDLDVSVSCPAGGGTNYYFWLGNGDGTFGSREKWSWPRNIKFF
jgi:hypothetical protein